MSESQAGATQPTEFIVRLGKDDWDKTTSSWRCPLLNVPGARAGDIFSAGDRIDKDRYEVSVALATIRWKWPEKPPEEIAATISVGASQLAGVVDSEAWWKKFGIITPIIVAIIGAAATILASIWKPIPPPPPPGPGMPALITAKLREWHANDQGKAITFMLGTETFDKERYVPLADKGKYRLVVGIRTRSTLAAGEGEYVNAYTYPFDPTTTQSPRMDPNMQKILATGCVDFVLFRISSARLALLPFGLPFKPSQYGSDLYVLSNNYEGSKCPN